METKKEVWTGKLDRYGKEIKVGDNVKAKNLCGGKHQIFFGKADLFDSSCGLWIDSVWRPFSDLSGWEFEILE